MMAKKSPKPLARTQSMAQFVSSVNADQLEKLQDLWSQLDSNRKGLVSANDLKEVMRNVNVDASEEEIRDLIKELDSDGDGKLSFKDFAKGVMRKQEQLSPTSTPSTASPKVTAKTLTPAASSVQATNSPRLSPATSSPQVANSPKPSSLNSPRLTPASASSPPKSPAPIPAAVTSSPQVANSPKLAPATSSVQAANSPRLSPATSSQATNSAKLTPATSSPPHAPSPLQKSSRPETPPGSPGTPKFVRSPSVVQFVKHLTGPQLAEMQTLFNHYDTDKDGRIDYASVRSIVREINPAIQKDEIQELLNAIDSNKDGLVNFKEFIDGTVMVYRTNKKHAEKLVKETKSEDTPPPSKKQIILQLKSELATKDQTIEKLQREIEELKMENTRLKCGKK